MGLKIEFELQHDVHPAIQWRFLPKGRVENAASASLSSICSSYYSGILDVPDARWGRDDKHFQLQHFERVNKAG